ncbi:MAG: bifunctional alpha/beta hydrolase/OsmC family protein [Rhodothermia bacterium]|nr:bifunctional alpha/beta hydrolase/OsmC family protein [Rhodothermia bacterium]
MESRKIGFDNARGETLSARLDVPVDGDPIAYALFAHCFTCSKDLKAVGNISRSLVSRGFGVLRFDFTGLGESEGEFSETNFSGNAEDIVAAAEMLEKDYEAPSILIGHSLGGAAVLLAAARLPHVKAIATIGAPFDPLHVSHLFDEAVDEIKGTGSAKVTIGGRPFKIERQFLRDLTDQNPTQYIGNLKRALAVFHSPVDQIVGIENASLIFEAARHPKSFISLDHADHLLTSADDSTYVGAVVAAWAGKYIDGPPQEEVKHLDPHDNYVVARIGDSGFQTEILANGHSLIADEPRTVGGDNTGPTPYDLLVAGLGACTAMTLRMYADRKDWNLTAVTVKLHHAKMHAEDCDCETKATGKIDKIDRAIRLEGDLSDEQRSRLIDIAEKCPVHRTLESGTVVVTTEEA